MISGSPLERRTGLQDLATRYPIGLAILATEVQRPGLRAVSGVVLDCGGGARLNLLASDAGVMRMLSYGYTRTLPRLGADADMLRGRWAPTS